MRIALKGYARSGKDTVGKVIKEYLEQNGHGHTRLMAFGDELRDRFHDAFPEAPMDPKPRESYEKFGQLGRDLDPELWIKSVEDDMKGWEGFADNFVITDLRQENEAQWCRDNGFILIEVWSPDKLREMRSNKDSKFIPINGSEKKIHEIECDHRIYNVDTLENLSEQVIEVLEEEIDK